MLNRMFSFLKRPTSKAVIINTLGNYLNVFFSTFFVYLLVRILNPAEYGVLSVLLGIMYVLANILDFGTTATIYSYLPPLVENNRKDAYKLVKSTIYYQTLFSLIAIVIFVVLFPWLDAVFFKTHESIWTFYITAVSVLCFIWQNFLANCLYAAKQVLQVNIYSLISNIIKTALVLGFAALHIINIGLVIFIFGVIGPLVFFILVYLEKKKHLNSIMAAPVSISDFRFRYTMTNFAASQFFNLGIRMDLFLLSYYRNKDEVGYYGLAQKIILTIITTVISITQVISPSFAKIKTKKDVFLHTKSGFFYMLIPTAIFLILAITPDFLFDFFFTHKFYEAAAIARQLGLAFILFPLLSLINLFLLYSVKKPQHMLVANIVFFAIISTGCFLFIPSYGALAAIFSIAIAFVINGGILVWSAFREYKKLSLF